MKRLCSWDFPCESCRAIQFPDCRRQLKLVVRIKHSKVALRRWGRRHRIRPGLASWPSGSASGLSSYFPRSWPELVSRPSLKTKHYFTKVHVESFLRLTRTCHEDSRQSNLSNSLLSCINWISIDDSIVISNWHSIFKFPKKYQNAIRKIRARASFGLRNTIITRY